MNDDIICAIATSRLEAAISIIRISGKGCINFVQSFFTGNLIRSLKLFLMAILSMVKRK